MEFIDLAIMFNFIQGKKLESRIRSIKDADHKYLLIKRLAKYYVRNYSGILFSGFIESQLLKLSNLIEPISACQTVLDRTLHIATELYDTGGHTRLINNWIKNDTSVKHDILVNEGSYSPQWLIETVNSHGGEIHYNKENGWFRKASYLRHKAATYKRIILHTHPDDLLPGISFGHGFSGIVLLYNHADHLFWVGVSVADVVLDMNHYASKVSRELRLVNRSHIVPIPLEKTAVSPINRESVREKFGIPMGKRIFLTVASEYKFLGENDIFFHQALQVAGENSCWVLIGPSPDSPKFRKLANKSRGAIVPMGLKNKSEVEELLSEADLYIDSFPSSSFTSMLQALESGVPVITTYPYELPDCLLRNRVGNISDMVRLDQNYLKSKYLVDAADAARAHSGEKWREIVAGTPPICAHKINLQMEKYHVHPYPRAFYKNRIRYKRWIRQCITLPFRLS